MISHDSPTQVRTRNPEWRCPYHSRWYDNQRKHGIAYKPWESFVAFREWLVAHNWNQKDKIYFQDGRMHPDSTFFVPDGVSCATLGAFRKTLNTTRVGNKTKARLNGIHLGHFINKQLAEDAARAAKTLYINQLTKLTKAF